MLGINEVIGIPFSSMYFHLENKNDLHIKNLKKKDNEIIELKNENAKLIKEKLSFNEKVNLEHKELNFRIDDLNNSLLNLPKVEKIFKNYLVNKRFVVIKVD